MYAYRRMFRGFLIILLDFRLGQFDMLPDFIGYGMILYGLRQLAEHNDFFDKAKIPTALLIIVSFPDFFYVDKNLLDVDLSTLSWLDIALVMQSLLSLALVYYLAHGILNLAKRRGLEGLIQSTRFRWNWYLGINLLLIGFSPFMINISPKRLTALAIPLLMLYLISYVLLLGLLSKAHKELVEEQGEAG